MNSFHDLRNDEASAVPVWRYKKERILFAFMGGRSWHTLAAVRELHTSCLHSDVSGLEKLGLKFHRERITVPGYGGKPTSVTCYTLAHDSYPLAARLLGIAAPQAPPDGDPQAYRKASGG
jgi:hypothetical protein